MKNRNANWFFSFPEIYDLKIKICNLVNPVSFFDINDYVRDKKVLNAGCGTRNIYFDETLPKELVGFDISKKFISKIRTNAKKGKYYVGSIDKIPYPDNYFDVTFVGFVFHHLTFKHDEILKELKRVTKDYIIIFDHKISSNLVKSLIQSIYWRILDGGNRYNTKKEWNNLLNQFTIKKRSYTGIMFRNVSQFILEVK